MFNIFHKGPEHFKCTRYVLPEFYLQVTVHFSMYICAFSYWFLGSGCKRFDNWQSHFVREWKRLPVWNYQSTECKIWVKVDNKTGPNSREKVVLARLLC